MRVLNIISVASTIISIYFYVVSHNPIFVAHWRSPQHIAHSPSTHLQTHAKNSFSTWKFAVVNPNSLAHLNLLAYHILSCLCHCHWQWHVSTILYINKCVSVSAVVCLSNGNSNNNSNNNNNLHPKICVSTENSVSVLFCSTELIYPIYCLWYKLQSCLTVGASARFNAWNISLSIGDWTILCSLTFENGCVRGCRTERR